MGSDESFTRNDTIFGDMNKFTHKGKWFLGDHRENMIDGKIEFRPETGPILSLKGILTDIEEPKIIQGISNNKDLITLVGCSMSEVGIHKPDQARQSFKINMIINGAHFSKTTDISFKSMRVKLTHLPEWLGIWDPIMLEKSSSFETTGFKYKDFDVMLEIDPKVKADIRSEDADIVKRVNDTTFVELQSRSQKNYSGFIEIINDVKYLLMIATNLNISAYDLQTTIGDVVVYIYYQFQDFFSNHSIVTPRIMLFVYDDVSDRLQSFVDQWLASRAILSDVYDLYLTSILRPGISSRQMFRNLANALECFHRFVREEETLECSGAEYKTRTQRIKQCLSQEDWEWVNKKLRNDISLKKMIYNLLNDEAIKNLITDIPTEKLVADIVDNRHEVTHSCKFIANDQELHELNKRMRVILEIIILRYLNFSCDSIQSALRASEKVRGRASPITEEVKECAALEAQYIYDTYGKFPATIPSIFLLTYLQAQHIDLDFYDHYFKPGAYLSTHKNHMTNWHSG